MVRDGEDEDVVGREAALGQYKFKINKFNYLIYNIELPWAGPGTRGPRSTRSGASPPRRRTGRTSTAQPAASEAASAAARGTYM